MSAIEIFAQEPISSHNDEAEQCLLGSAIMSPKAAKWLQTHGKPEWFHNSAHREICAAILKLGNAKIVCDIVTLVEQLTSQKSRISEDYLMQCIEATPSPTNVAGYGAVVSNHWRKRVFAKRLTKFLEGLEVVEFGELESLIAKSSRLSDGLMWFGNSVSKLSEIDLTENGAEGLPIGMEQIDLRTSCRGIPKGNVTLIVAPKKVGKSTIALQWFCNLAQFGEAAFISLEMSRSAIKRKIMQQRCGMWRTPELNQPDLFMDESGNEKMIPLKVWNKALAEIDSWTGATIYEPKGMERKVEHICGWIEDRHRTEPAECYFIDYAQKLESEFGQRFKGNRVQELEYISSQITTLAATIGVPIVVLAQSSDQAATNSMEIEVKGCRAFEQDCALMITIARKDGYLYNAALRNNRFGQSDIDLKFNWDRKRIKFIEALTMQGGEWVEA